MDEGAIRPLGMKAAQGRVEGGVVIRWLSLPFRRALQWARLSKTLALVLTGHIGRDAHEDQVTKCRAPGFDLDQPGIGPLALSGHLRAACICSCSEQRPNRRPP